MKQNLLFSDYPEMHEKVARIVTNLQKWQTFLWFVLGGVFTYAILGISSPDSLFDTFAAVFLWFMLLLAPAAGGIVILKFPFWQQLSLSQRQDVILYSFGLSLLTWCTVILFGLRSHRYEPEFWLTVTAVTLGFGGFILWLYFRMSRQAMMEAGDLFP